MHPVEAISILSQLAYVQPGTATSFPDEYAWKFGYSSLPVHAPTEPYTPLYHEFTYASNFRLERTTPNTYYSASKNWDGSKPELSTSYNPALVGRQTSYEHTLFLMTRDMAVLTALDKVKPTSSFYCVRNEDPIESKLSEAAFIVEFNVNTVYPCTGPEHDAHVPKCLCPVPPPSVRLTALAERIKAHRAAAPFATRLRDLYAAVADAHKAAAALEINQFPLGTLLANFTFAENAKDTVQEFLTAGFSDAYYANNEIGFAKLQRIKRAQKQTENAITYKQDNFKRAAAARAAADAAEAELAAYIAAKEDAAFAAFKPEVRPILTTMRTNMLAGYTVPVYPLTSEHINPLLTKVNPPQNKWSDGQTDADINDIFY